MDKFLKYLPIPLVVVIIFQAGIIWVKIQSIDNKLDKSEYQNIREKDSLRAVIRDKELIRLKREVNLPPETTKTGTEKLTPAKVMEEK